jgi:hypothetical protein
MKIITGLSEQPKQQSTLVLADGTRAVWSISYVSQQTGWFYDLSWNGTVIATGQRMVSSPNILRQYINKISFGIAVISPNQLEPTTQTALADGSITCYLLEGADLEAIETAVFNAPPGQVQPVTTTVTGLPAVVLPANWGPAGGDLAYTYPNPQVVAMHDSTGQRLAFGVVAEGKFLKRDGETIVGATVAPGTGDVTGPASSTVGNVAVWNDTGGTEIADGGTLGTAAFLPSSNFLGATAAASGDLSGNYPSPNVAAIHTTSGGGTKLTIGAVADGEFLVRSGSTLIGGTPSGAGDVFGPSGAVGIGTIALFAAGDGKLLGASSIIPAGMAAQTPSSVAITGGSISGTTITASSASLIALDVNSSGGVGAIEVNGASGALVDLKSPSSDDYDLRMYTSGSGGEIAVSGDTNLDFLTNGTRRVRVNTSGINVTGNVVASGTLTLGNQPANKVFSGPSTGADASPSFRFLVASDLPNTSVSSGSYELANITVDAQGRLTAASTGAGVRTVSTMSALRALNPSAWADGIVVILLGYYYGQDGGGGDFTWQSGNSLGDDSGCIIKPDSISGDGRFIRIMPGISVGTPTLVGVTFNVRWFGCIPYTGNVYSGFSLASAAAKRTTTTHAATVYFPAGTYNFETPIDETYDLGVTIKGDGPSTIITSNISVQQTAAFKFQFFNGGGILDLNFDQAAFPTSARHLSLVWIAKGVNAIVSRVQIYGYASTGTLVNLLGPTPGGILRTNGEYLSMSDVLVKGGGVAWYQDGGSGVYNNIQAISTTVGDNPAVHWKGSNTLQWNNVFIQGAGPSIKRTSVALTSSSASFTLDVPYNPFSVGEYIRIRGAANAGYNKTWQISSITGGSITVNNGPNLGNDTVTLTSLWSGLYISGAGLVTESSISKCVVNTPGGLTDPYGVCGVFVDGFHGNTSGVLFSDFLVDLGATAFFLNGITTAAPTPGTSPTVIQYGANVGDIILDGCQANTGGLDDFGCIRLEGVVNVVCDSCKPIVGDNLSPGSGKTFSSYVISDGGQTVGYTRDINITGGRTTSHISSEIYPYNTCYAFTFAGARVKYVNVTTPSIDATSSNARVSRFIATSTGTASQGNGITILYANNTGELYLVGSGSSSDSGARVLTDGSNVIGSIGQFEQWKYVVEYAWEGFTNPNIAFSGRTNVYINVVVNITFAFNGLASGNSLILTLKNATGSTYTLAWPSGINWANGSTPPSSIAPGVSHIFNMYAYGTTYSTIFAKY